VDFMTGIHQRVAQFSMENPGTFADGARMCMIGRAFTPEEVRLIEANPYLTHVHPGTVPLEKNIGMVSYRLTGPTAIREELGKLSDWYNNARRLPGRDPYRVAAELQQRFVSIHPFMNGNGHTSRLLMNWALEREGLAPSILSDVDRDILSTPGQWADEVRAGSRTFAEREDLLRQSGADADPIRIFSLQQLRDVYWDQGGVPLEVGDYHDVGMWREFLKGLEPGR
jgi:hypothetical protein